MMSWKEKANTLMLEGEEQNEGSERGEVEERDRPPPVASIKKITERSGAKEKTRAVELRVDYRVRIRPRSKPEPEPSLGSWLFQARLWKHWVCSFAPQTVWWRAASRRQRSHLSSRFFSSPARRVLPSLLSPPSHLPANHTPPLQAQQLLQISTCYLILFSASSHELLLAAVSFSLFLFSSC